MYKKILTLVNQKGGVGKTTTAINLSQYLALKGKKTLLIDLDPQANATSGLGVDKNSLRFSLYDSLIRGVPIEQIILTLNGKNLFLAPSSSDLSGASVELTRLPQREFLLYKTIRRVLPMYEYIIIDSPPSLDLLTINGLVASEGVVIPIQCEYYALEGLSRLLEVLSLVKKSLKPNLEIMGMVLTMFDKRNKLARQVVLEMQNNFPGLVFKSVVPRNVRLSEAPSFGKPIAFFDPISRGAKSYEQLAEELIMRNG